MTVECSDCGSETIVFGRSKAMGMVSRTVECRCGSRFETIEKIARRLPSQQGLNLGNKPSLNSATDVETRSLNAVEMAPEGGLGGGPAGGSIQSDLSVISAQLLSKRQTRLRVGRSGRGDAKEYPAEFEAVWLGCTDRRGNKYPACRAWLKFKLPASVICPVYLRWAETDSWQRGYTPHLSTWLNERGWENEPTAKELAPRTEPARAPVLPLAMRIEDARAARAVAARIDGLRASGILRPRDPKPAPPDHVRELADGKAIR